jgi:hypothetical protein
LREVRNRFDEDVDVGLAQLSWRILVALSLS